MNEKQATVRWHNRAGLVQMARLWREQHPEATVVQVTIVEHKFGEHSATVFYTEEPTTPAIDVTPEDEFASILENYIAGGH